MGGEQGSSTKHAEVSTANDSSSLSPGPLGGLGVGEVRELLSHGRPEPEKIAEIVIAHPNEREPIFALVQQTAGNSFAQAVIHVLQHPPTASAGTSALPPTADEQSIDKMPTLHLGARGPEVLRLKASLIGHGFQSVKYPVDAGSDEFDGHTRIAVRKLQWSFGLDVDGAVGKGTWLMLFGHAAGTYVDLHDPTAAPKAIAATPGYDAAVAAGRARRKAWHDWGSEPPVAAQPGDYGDDWAMTAAGEIRVGGDTNWRYCNPGNILPGFTQHYAIGSVSAVNVAQPSGLAMFPTWELGFVALHTLLLSGLYRHQTVGSFTSTYLGIPMGKKSEFGDDPVAYKNSVGKNSGLSSDRVIETLDDGELKKLMLAIRIVEGVTEGHTVNASSASGSLLHAFDPP